MKDNFREDGYDHLQLHRLHRFVFTETKLSHKNFEHSQIQSGLEFLNQIRLHFPSFDKNDSLNEVLEYLSQTTDTIVWNHATSEVIVGVISISILEVNE